VRCAQRKKYAESGTFIPDSEAGAEIPNCKYRRKEIMALSNAGGKWNNDTHIKKLSGESHPNFDAVRHGIKNTGNKFWPAKPRLRGLAGPGNFQA
jgi:hypothetical protein